MFNTSLALLLVVSNSVAAQNPIKIFLRVGMLLVAKEGTEYLNTVGIDLFGILKSEYQTLIGSLKPLKDEAVRMETLYIRETGQGDMSLTANDQVVITVSPSNIYVEDVCKCLTVLILDFL
jgi:hypothetical protein